MTLTHSESPVVHPPTSIRVVSPPTLLRRDALEVGPTTRQDRRAPSRRRKAALRRTRTAVRAHAADLGLVLLALLVVLLVAACLTS